MSPITYLRCDDTSVTCSTIGSTYLQNAPPMQTVEVKEHGTVVLQKVHPVMRVSISNKEVVPAHACLIRIGAHEEEHQ